MAAPSQKKLLKQKPTKKAEVKLFGFRLIVFEARASTAITAAMKMLRSMPAGAVGIATRIGNHTFRATGLTTYLKNGGTLEKAAVMANHASTRTTQLYDRRRDHVTLDEVERVLI